MSGEGSLLQQQSQSAQAIPDPDRRSKTLSAPVRAGRSGMQREERWDDEYCDDDFKVMCSQWLSFSCPIHEFLDTSSQLYHCPSEQGEGGQEEHVGGGLVAAAGSGDAGSR
jgi:hypothetical protein